VLRRSEVFFPYFSMRTAFDAERTHARLERAGIRVSPLESYFDRLVDFALEADWGRRQVGRGRAAAPVGRSARLTQPAPVAA
jgi:hypothetical protein